MKSKPIQINIYGIILIVLTLVSLILIVLSFILPDVETNNILKNHYTVICEVKTNRWRATDYEYEINGEKYIYTRGNLSKCAFETEKYWCLVSKSDLKSARVLYSMPIIDTIQYDYDTTKPKWIQKFENGKEYQFTYFINNERFDRMQFYTKKTKLKFEDLIVIYRKINPSIGYLVDLKSK